MLQVKTLVFNTYLENTYLIKDESGRCIAVDPAFCGADEEKIFFDALSASGLDAVLLTHGHFDHIHGVAALKNRFPDIPVYMSEKDEYTLLQNDFLCKVAGVSVPKGFSWIGVPQEVVFGRRTIKVVPTPGHTPGSVAYYFEEDGLLFSGDTLFAGTIGRSDLPGGDYEELMRSVWYIMDNMPSGTDVLPGHGPATSIGKEATTNPMLVPVDAECGDGK